MVGTAIDVASTVGGFFAVVVVEPIVIVDDFAARLGVACSWPSAMLSTPMVTTALPPITAAKSLMEFLPEFISEHLLLVFFTCCRGRRDGGTTHTGR
jgi:hypothetical protein